jgi:hypothetical protein
MDRDKIIKVTSAVSITSIILLIYWVFIFVSITVFEFRVFRENLTETFYLSILGIFAVLGGALIVNVILNMSKIAEALAQQNSAPIEKKQGRRLLVPFIISFPLIFILLYGGDYASSAKKRNYLTRAAESIADQNRKDLESIGSYTFTTSYINTTDDIITRISKEEEQFPSISVIIADTIGAKQTLLQFTRSSSVRDGQKPEKIDYIYSCSAEERAYLMEVLEGKRTDTRFSSNDGRYELYYPVKTGKRTVVLYFNDHSQYGKIGS